MRECLEHLPPVTHLVALRALDAQGQALALLLHHPENGALLRILHGAQRHRGRILPRDALRALGWLQQAAAGQQGFQPGPASEASPASRAPCGGAAGAGRPRLEATPPAARFAQALRCARTLLEQAAITEGIFLQAIAHPQAGLLQAWQAGQPQAARGAALLLQQGSLRLAQPLRGRWCIQGALLQALWQHPPPWPPSQPLDAASPALWPPAAWVSPQAARPPQPGQLGAGVQIEAGVRIAAGARIHGMAGHTLPSLIGPQCTLAPGCELHAILEAGVTTAPGLRLLPGVQLLQAQGGSPIPPCTFSLCGRTLSLPWVPPKHHLTPTANPTQCLATPY